MNTPKWDRLKILWAIDTARLEKGSRLTWEDAKARRYGLPSSTTIERYCGTWRQACRDAGVEISNRGPKAAA